MKYAIGLGSSDPRALDWLRKALACLKAERGIRLLGTSRVYQSDAMMPEGAPANWNVPYLNLASLCETSLGPLDLLDRLQAIEKRLGRVQRERWAPREIDLDLLAGPEIESPRLSIPHRGLRDRSFALLPLQEVWPEWIEKDAPSARAVRDWRSLAVPVPYQTQATTLALTELVGILNVTPDSFSDGGRLLSRDGLIEGALLDAATLAVRGGATVLDIGAESTRPGASAVDADEEWRRLEPALRSLQALRGAQASPVKLSLDTRHARSAARALEHGWVDWLNDVSGFESPEMRAVAAAAGNGPGAPELVFMHSLEVPPTPHKRLPPDADPIAEIEKWAIRRIEECEADGIARERLILDPGIGFGKSVSQNFRIVGEAGRLHALGLRLLVGHSRKGFLAGQSPAPLALTAADRDVETLLASEKLAAQEIEYLRVHRIDWHRRMLEMRANFMT
jgi:2-amino-4-hydroxy-6-hydroxymethyldihydropteridine diphosphokinase/dihydropteroate synthase